MDSQPADLKPKRVALFFTSASEYDELTEVIEHVAENAEASGLFFEWAAIGHMSIDDVPHGSPLHQVLNGKFPDR